MNSRLPFIFVRAFWMISHYLHGCLIVDYPAFLLLSPIDDPDSLLVDGNDDKDKVIISIYLSIYKDKYNIYIIYI